jgi:DNA-directed RNA polymerase specialized sigma24 family protein
VLFDEYARAACDLGFWLTAGWSAAEEVVSLTFLEAWPKRSRIEADESLRPWLLGIAVSRNLARASRRGDAQVPPRS